MKVERAWLQDHRTQAVFRLLESSGHQAFVVGGCVRNALIDLPVSDVDFATDATPDEVLALAQGASMRAIPTGLAHGTVTLVPDGQSFEVTTFRKDVETDGRHAVVSFSKDVETDAQRRDFTVNALYASADGTLLDPLGGLPDLDARIIRFIGDPFDRIREDALRMLRFFRFYAWYGDPTQGLDPDGLAAVAQQVERAGALSRERVGAEMKKLLSAPDPAPAVAAMGACGLLSALLPGAAPSALAPLIAVEDTAPLSWHRRLAALGGENADDRLRLSRADAAHLAGIRAALAADEPPSVAAYRHSPEVARDATLIRAAALLMQPPQDLEAAIAIGSREIFPLRGGDLSDHLSPGPAMGRALKGLEEEWIASGFALSRDELLANLTKG